jgi:hypothetical protein
LQWSSDSKVSSARVLSILGEEWWSVKGSDIRNADLTDLPSGKFLVEISSGTSPLAKRFIKD